MKDFELERELWSRKVRANLRLSEDVSLSPAAQQTKEFVEALLDLNAWGGTKSDGASQDFLMWRHHSFVTTLSILGGLAAEESRGQAWNLGSIARSDGLRRCLVSTGNPVAISKWLSDKGLRGRWPFKQVSSVENWPLERIRAELVEQRLADVWPRQAMRIIAFALLRDNIVKEVDFERLCKMKGAELRKQASLLGDSVELEAAKPERTSRRPKPQPTSSRRATERENSKFKQWLAAGRPWIRGANLDGAEFVPLLVGLYETGRRWPTAGSPKAPKPRDPDWLDELLARAVDLARLLRVEPAWPTTFDDDRIRVTISVFDTTLVGWVEIGLSKSLVAVDLDAWEVTARGVPGNDELAAGLTIAWYLDSCICLRKIGHPHFRLEKMRGQVSAGSPKRGTVYFPTPKFRSDVTSTSHGKRVSPQAHRVRGHVRELSSSRNPSVTARNNAPWYIRRHLKRHDTFVKSHSRGKEGKSREMSVYLSRYSTLADALGSI